MKVIKKELAKKKGMCYDYRHKNKAMKETLIFRRRQEYSVTD